MSNHSGGGDASHNGAALSLLEKFSSLNRSVDATRRATQGVRQRIDAIHRATEAALEDIQEQKRELVAADRDSENASLPTQRPWQEVIQNYASGGDSNSEGGQNTARGDDLRNQAQARYDAGRLHHQTAKCEHRQCQSMLAESTQAFLQDSRDFRHRLVQQIATCRQSRNSNGRGNGAATLQYAPLRAYYRQLESASMMRLENMNDADNNTMSPTLAMTTTMPDWLLHEQKQQQEGASSKSNDTAESDHEMEEEEDPELWNLDHGISDNPQLEAAWKHYQARKAARDEAATVAASNSSNGGDDENNFARRQERIAQLRAQQDRLAQDQREQDILIRKHKAAKKEAQTRAVTLHNRIRQWQAHQAAKQSIVNPYLHRQTFAAEELGAPSHDMNTTNHEYANHSGSGNPRRVSTEHMMTTTTVPVNRDSANAVRTETGDSVGGSNDQSAAAINTSNSAIDSAKQGSGVALDQLWLSDDDSDDDETDLISNYTATTPKNKRAKTTGM